MKLSRSKLSDLFWAHELWALSLAMKIPFFSILFMGTLMLWLFPFAIPLLPLTFFMISQSLPIVGFASVAMMLLGALFFAVVTPVFFGNYFMCVSLMLRGHSERAEARHRFLTEKLKA